MSARPLRFEDGALLVLDQRALPGPRRTGSAASPPPQVADCIRDMAVRGAPAIGVAAAYGMALAQQHGEDLEPAAAHAARHPPDGRESRLGAGTRAGGSAGPGVGESLLDLARALHREQDEADRRLSAFGAERFEPGDRALTHCNAGALATAGYGTACGVLRSAWERGRLAQVWVDETRPLLQGARLTAWELRRPGIPHRVVADSAAGSLIARGEVDRVVVGADRIAANGDVANKIGTYPLAVLAARHGVPFYVAAPLSTVDPDTPRRRGHPDRGARPGRGHPARPGLQPGLRRHPGRARHGHLHRGRRARAARTRSRSGVSLRAEIVAAAQEMLRLGLVAGTSGNMSAREGELVHITPSGLPYPEMTEADLVTLSAAGDVVEGRARAVERAARAPRRIRGAARRGRDRAHPQRARHRLELPRRAARHRDRGDRAGRRRCRADRALRADRLG